MYDNPFHNFRSPIPNDLCTDSVLRHPWFWRRFFKVFTISAWRPSWSMDCDHFSNLLFPQPNEAPCEIWAKLAQRIQKSEPNEAPCEIWAKLAQRIQRRSHLKILTDRRTDWRTDGQWTKSDHYSSSWAYLRWAKNTQQDLLIFIIVMDGVKQTM